MGRRRWASCAQTTLPVATSTTTPAVARTPRIAWCDSPEAESGRGGGVWCEPFAAGPAGTEAPITPAERSVSGHSR